MKKKSCYCSYCRNERSYIAKKHINIFDILFLIIPSVLLSLIFWQSLDPRLLVFWVVMGISYEVLTQIRWRLAIVCQFCGFDPVLYLQNPEKAAEKVTNFMEERKQSATYLLSSKQFNKVPRRRIVKNIYESNDKTAST